MAARGRVSFEHQRRADLHGVQRISVIVSAMLIVGFAGTVCAAGKAPTKDARDLAEEITKNTEGVKTVHNDIVVAP